MRVKVVNVKGGFVDIYSKFVLTVIAGALSSIGFNLQMPSNLGSVCTLKTPCYISEANPISIIAANPIPISTLAPLEITASEPLEITALRPVDVNISEVIRTTTVDTIGVIVMSPVEVTTGISGVLDVKVTN